MFYRWLTIKLFFQPFSFTIMPDKAGAGTLSDYCQSVQFSCLSGVESVEKVPEERQAAERKVSAEAADYFASLRERQAELVRQEAAVDYHKLREGGWQ